MTSQRRTQIAVSAIAVLAASCHLIWPLLRIDVITLTLLLVAALPWLLPLFKRIELPGGVKFEFQELRASERRAEALGLLEPQPVASTESRYSFQLVANEDPNLALAGLRIEIERRLKLLAESAGIETAKTNISQLLRSLGASGMLTDEQRNVLSDMIHLLNSAVHGATADERSADWALKVGPRLLATLDKRIPQQ